MKRRVYGGSPTRGRWRYAGVLFVGIGLVIFVLLKLQALVVDNSMDDVLKNRHDLAHQNSAKPNKLAFLFLARESMPLDFLWQHFFEVSACCTSLLPSNLLCNNELLANHFLMRRFLAGFCFWRLHSTVSWWAEILDMHA